MNEAKMEGMLTQLIKMVGSLQSDMQEVKKEQQEMKNNLQELETKSDQRHQEVLEHFKILERDQDFIWEKT